MQGSKLFLPVPITLQWLPPWEPVEKYAEVLVAELVKELHPRHVLFGRPAKAIARKNSCDDVLFAIDDAASPLAMVHLTWSSHASSDELSPWTNLFMNWADWVEQILLPDHQEYMSFDEGRGNSP